MKIIGINGMTPGLLPNTGVHTTDRMLAVLRARNWPVHDFQFPPVRFWQTRSRARLDAIAHRLVEISSPGDVIVAHSYGCLVAARAMEFGFGRSAKFSQVFFFRPAMPAEHVFPVGAVDRVHVVKCGTDRALRKTRLLLPYHPMGQLGRIGYHGPEDSRVRVIEVGEFLPGVCTEPLNHNLDFHPPQLEFWSNYVCSELLTDQISRHPLGAAFRKTQKMEIES